MKAKLQLKVESGQTPAPTSTHSPARLSALLQHKSRPAISEPSDHDEHAADRMADAVTRGAKTESLYDSRATQTNGIAAASPNGLPLDATTRAFMEPRFGHDFSKVRILTDHESAQTAQWLNARAFTIGNSISFGPGEYDPVSSTGRHLLAHELAHVVQQSHQPQRKMLHRKLTMTGTTANINRALAILNGGLFGYTASADSAGNITVARNGIEGPPTEGQNALYNELNTILSASRTVTVAVEAGTGTTLVGSWAGRSIDVTDMETMGAGPSGSVATLIHELVEQYQGQVLSAGYGGQTTGAHGTGIAAESAVVGATRGAQRDISSSVNADGTVNAVVEVPWTYPNGTVVTVTLTIVSNNVISVTRR